MFLYQSQHVVSGKKITAISTGISAAAAAS
jgi:hypothetical protein